MLKLHRAPDSSADVASSSAWRVQAVLTESLSWAKWHTPVTPGEAEAVQGPLQGPQRYTLSPQSKRMPWPCPLDFKGTQVCDLVSQHTTCQNPGTQDWAGGWSGSGPVGLHESLS